MKDKTLAQRCFEQEEADMELFDKVNEILGSEPKENCLKNGYIFEVGDSWCDPYDRSVEIIRHPDSEWMTPEQAVKIQGFGFDFIYESRGEECRHWNGSKFSMGYHKEGDEERILKAKNRALMAENAVLRKGLGELKKLTMVI